MLAEWWAQVWTGSDSYIFGQVLGLFLLVYNSLIFFPKKRENILKLKIVSDAIAIVHHTLVGTYTAAVLCCVMVLRESVFMLRGKKKWASSVFWLFFNNR